MACWLTLWGLILPQPSQTSLPTISLLPQQLIHVNQSNPFPPSSPNNHTARRNSRRSSVTGFPTSSRFYGITFLFLNRLPRRFDSARARVLDGADQSRFLRPWGLAREQHRWPASQSKAEKKTQKNIKKKREGICLSSFRSRT